MKGQISVYKACTKDFVESKDVDEWQNTRRTHRLEIVDRLGTSSYTCLPLAILLISVGNSTLHRKDCSCTARWVVCGNRAKPLARFYFHFSRTFVVMLEFRTEGFNGYSVKYSPFFDSRIAVAASANFGLVGNGRLYILGLTPNGIVVEKW